MSEVRIPKKCSLSLVSNCLRSIVSVPSTCDSCHDGVFFFAGISASVEAEQYCCSPEVLERNVFKREVHYLQWVLPKFTRLSLQEKNSLQNYFSISFLSPPNFIRSSPLSLWPGFARSSQELDLVTVGDCCSMASRLKKNSSEIAGMSKKDDVTSCLSCDLNYLMPSTKCLPSYSFGSNLVTFTDEWKWST